MVDYHKLKNIDLQWKELWKYTKIIEVLNRLIAKELWFTIEKLWYYGKTMIPWKRNYGTMEKTMKLWFTMEKTDTMEKKTMVL